MTTLYTQCELSRGPRRQISWLPNRFAVQGSVVKLKDDGRWEDGWRVETAYHGVVLAHQELVERSQDYKRTRLASDI